MIPIALITCKKFPRLDDDNKLLLKSLREAGFTPYPVIWNQNSVEWKKFKAIIVRSPWDYHRHFNDFYTWLSKIESLSIPVWNPIPILKWNSDKFRYLSDLSKKHIPVIPSVFLDKGTLINLSYLLYQKKWGAAVVKPRFGGSGEGVYKVTASDAQKLQKKFDRFIIKHDVIVQQFMNEIENGEYSFIFLNGTYSHTVLKKPRPNEYRTNYAFGGVWKTISPGNDFIHQAKRIINTIPTPLLYARVDALNVKGQLVLNELELIDPMLFLQWHPQAAKTFVSNFKMFMS